jgi:hypothetical protein
MSGLLPVLLTMLTLVGISIEMNPTARPWQLFVGLHLAGLAAMAYVSLSLMKSLPTKIKRYGFVVLQLLAFRIAYFPIVVFAATVACYVELLLQDLPGNVPFRIFPALLVSAALMFAAINWILFQALKGKAGFYVLIIIMTIPALLISFADRHDLTVLPDNNWSDIQSLPAIAQPQANPYVLGYESNQFSAGQKLTAFAGRVLYEFIPQAKWSQAVQGTLEQEFRNKPGGNSHDQLRSHYAAFLAAHQAIKSIN